MMTDLNEADGILFEAMLVYKCLTGQLPFVLNIYGYEFNDEICMILSANSYRAGCEVYIQFLDGSGKLVEFNDLVLRRVFC